MSVNKAVRPAKDVPPTPKTDLTKIAEAATRESEAMYQQSLAMQKAQENADLRNMSAQDKDATH